MASCMIHLYACWLYAQKNTEFLDHPNFYLGCILPDCSLIWVDLQKKKFVGIPI